MTNAGLSVSRWKDLSSIPTLVTMDSVDIRAWGRGKHNKDRTFHSSHHSCLPGCRSGGSERGQQDWRNIQAPPSISSLHSSQEYRRRTAHEVW